MTGQMQVLFAWVSAAVTVVGLSISVFAFWNSYQARLENRTNVLFRLKIEALSIAHEVDASWQAIVDEVENAQRQFRKLGGDAISPTVRDVLRALVEWEKAFRESKANAKKIADDCDRGFDDWSAKNAADVLRACIRSKIILEHARDKMGQRFSQMGDDGRQLEQKPSV